MNNLGEEIGKKIIGPLYQKVYFPILEKRACYYKPAIVEDPYKLTARISLTQLIIITQCPPPKGILSMKYAAGPNITGRALEEHFKKTDKIKGISIAQSDNVFTLGIFSSILKGVIHSRKGIPLPYKQGETLNLGSLLQDSIRRTWQENRVPLFSGNIGWIHLTKNRYYPHFSLKP